MSRGSYDRLDDALAILAPVEGLGNHGPMVAEALCALGRGDAVVGWVESYRKRFKPFRERGATVHRIDEGNWGESLGKIERMEDWSQFFLRAIEESPWESVLDLWVQRLAPGFSAVAVHGAIRTCHAVRALVERDTKLRRLGLADGLAHWAAGYAVLPEGVYGGEKLRPTEALSRIEILPADRRRPVKSIMQALQDLNGFEAFPPVIGMIDENRPVELLISELTEAFSRAFLANSNEFLETIAFVHSVTGPAGLRLIAAHVSEEAMRTLLRYAWQASAGIYVRFAVNPPVESSETVEFDREELIAPENLIDRAMACEEEHAVKFTEACLREYQFDPKPIYLSAALRVVEVFSGKAAL
ncbi:MAG: DUF4243 domain-containing protein [Planctomycetaceae bacterium]|nr:DUF4243 domain-containing protein [Planctomycetaceae bacterium]